MPTGIRMTKRNKLRIVKRARKILSDPYSWTVGALRKKTNYGEGDPQWRYCALGACERAAYDLGLAEERTGSFGPGSEALGYQLSHELGLHQFSVERLKRSVPEVNDGIGYTTTVKLLDEFICETESVVKPRGKRTL